MPAQEFDVFLGHNSRDKPLVRELARLLRKRGLRVWLDEDELVPGEPWQKGLEKGLLSCGAIAVCVGEHQSGRWQDPEMLVALDLAMKNRLRVVPVLLPGASESPELSLFLRRHTWVDLRRGLAWEQVDRLVWGITGRKAAPSAPKPAMENPFGQVGPIRDRQRFVGREAELRRLKEMLRHGSAVILGPGKLGKTSLLLRVADGWEGEVLGPLNFQSYVSEDDFLDDLAKAVGSAARDWPSLREHLLSHRLLLLLDEIDAAPAAGISVGLFIRIRAVLNTNPHCAVLASSQHPLSQLYPGAAHAGSPAFSLIQPFPLGDLKREGASQLLDHPWAPETPCFDEATKAKLIAVAGLHPFRLLRAAFHCFESRFEEGYDWIERWRLDVGSLL